MKRKRPSRRVARRTKALQSAVPESGFPGSTPADDDMELGDRAAFPDVTFRQTCHVLSCSVWDLFAFCVVAARAAGHSRRSPPLPPFLSLPPTSVAPYVAPRPSAPRARDRGRPTSPIGRSSGFAGGFFHFIISSAVSVRARWKKGQGAAKGKLPVLVYYL